MANDYHNEPFSSSDLALVAAVSMRYPIDAIDKQDPHRAVFYFQRSSGLDDFLRAYHSGELRVNPASFFQQLRIVKARLYEND